MTKINNVVKIAVLIVWALAFLSGCFILMFKSSCLSHDNQLWDLIRLWGIIYLPSLAAMFKIHKTVAQDNRIFYNIFAIVVTLFFNCFTLFILYRFFFLLHPINPMVEEGLMVPLKNFALFFYSIPITILVYFTSD